MGELAPMRPSGLRRYSQFNAIVDKLAKGFEGQEGLSPSRLLNKLKRAAPYMGVPRNVVSLMDVLVAFSRSQDWAPGQTPCVWPRNETLSVKLGVSVRQVQNYVRAAVEHGLLTPKDSANGHRGGLRAADGKILWSYGFDLSPLAARAQEFEAIAAKGEAEDREIERLRKTIAALRRRTRMLAETCSYHMLDGIDAEHEVDLVRMAVTHIRGSRNIDQLVRCVALLTKRVDLFQGAVEDALTAGKAQETAENPAFETMNPSPKDEMNFVHSTTTTQLQTANAVTSRGLAGRSSEAWDIALLAPKSAVEDDLDRHGIDPGFVAKACPELIWDLDPGPRAWGRLVSIAEGLVGQHAISLHAWREACRIMGQHGAAAAVIATVYKAMSGEVRRPGAYLRGMNEKALSGALHLGKTYHGLREASSQFA